MYEHQQTTQEEKKISYERYLELRNDANSGKFKNFVIDFLDPNLINIKLVYNDDTVERLVVVFDKCEHCGQEIRP